VHLPAKAPLAPLGVLLGRDAALGGTRAEVRGGRLDRSEHDLAHQVRERPTADRRETLREHDVAEIAVGERAEILRERLLRRPPYGLLERVDLLPERQPPGEAAGVREHVTQRDVVLPTAAEIRHELAERCV